MPPPQERTDSRRTRTREFFAPRAAGWDDRFPDDDPAYALAVHALGPIPGRLALDAACGTGRALPHLRSAVGDEGFVLGVDLTPEMLREVANRGRGDCSSLVLSDVHQLPLRDGSIDVVFGAGLLPHLDDPIAGLGELARVTRSGGRMALFHPIGRLTLAARHGHLPDPDDVRAEPAIRLLLGSTGWRCDSVDDGLDRYLVIATRR